MSIPTKSGHESGLERNRHSHMVEAALVHAHKDLVDNYQPDCFTLMVALPFEEYG